VTTLAKLAVKIQGDTEHYEKSLDRSTKKTDKFGDMVSQIGKVAIGIGLVGGIMKAAGAIKKLMAESIQAFEQFEEGIKEVYTLLPGISEVAMVGMEADVLRLSTSMGRMTDEIVPALYQAISAGVPQENVFEFLETAHETALAGVTDLSTAVDGLTTVVNAYGPGVISAAEASDVMFAAVKGGKTTFKEMSDRLFQMVPVAASLGLEFGNLTAAIATMTAQGTPTRQAATQIRAILQELAVEGTKTSDAFKQVAGVGFAQFIEQGGNLQDAMILMEQAAADQGVAMMDLFGSIMAAQGALQLTGSGAEKFTTELQNAENAEGATTEAADVMNEALLRQEERAASLAAAFKILMGESLEPLRRKFLDAKISILEWEVENMSATKINKTVASSLDEYRGQITDTSSSLQDSSDAVRGYNKEQALSKLLIKAVTDEGLDHMAGNLSQERSIARLHIALGLLEDGWTGQITELRAAIDLQEQADIRADALNKQYAAFAGNVDDTTEAIEANNKVMLTQDEILEGLFETNVDMADSMQRRMLQSDEEAMRINRNAAMVRQANQAMEDEKIAREEATQAAIDYATAIADATARVGDYFAAAVQGADGANFFYNVIEEGEPAVLTGTMNQDTLNQAMLKAASDAGVGAVGMAVLGQALGVYSEEAAEAALKSALIQEKINTLAQSYVAGNISVADMRTELSGFIQDLDLAADTAGRIVEANNAMDVANQGTGESVVALTGEQQRYIDKMGIVDDETVTTATVMQEQFILIKDGATENMGLTVTAFDTGMTTMSTMTTTEMGTILGETDTTMTGIATATDTAMTSVNTNISTGLTEAQSTIRSYRTGFETAGGYIASGIGVGILSKSYEIAAAAAQVVRDAMAAARAETEASSPAKKPMREIGYPFAQGIALGILSGADEIRDAAASVVGSAITDIEPLGNGGYAGDIGESSPVIIEAYITIEGATASPDEIAEEVATKIAELARLHQAAGV